MIDVDLCHFMVQDHASYPYDRICGKPAVAWNVVRSSGRLHVRCWSHYVDSGPGLDGLTRLTRDEAAVMVVLAQ